MSVKWKGYPEDQNTEESEEMLAESVVLFFTSELLFSIERI